MVLVVGVAVAGSVAWAVRDTGIDTTGNEIVVDIVVPESKVATLAERNKDGACASGCSLKNHPVPPFTAAQFGEALADYATRVPDESSEPLDTLLFYGKRTLELIDEYGTAPLPESHVEFLRRELSRSHAYVALRLVDEHGVVRAQYPDTRVPIGVKQHLKPEMTNLHPVEFNGTVMRVGLSYVWSRF
jgi:hypothetical protein